MFPRSTFRPPGPALDGGKDGAVLDLDAAALHNRPVGLDGCIEGCGVRDELVVLLAGHVALLDQVGIPLHLFPGVCGLGPVFCQVRLRLPQGRLVGAAVELEETKALLYVLAFLEADVGDLGADLGSHRHRGIGIDPADGGDLDRDVLLHHLGDGDGRWGQLRGLLPRGACRQAEGDAEGDSKKEPATRQRGSSASCLDAVWNYHVGPFPAFSASYRRVTPTAPISPSR